MYGSPTYISWSNMKYRCGKVGIYKKVTITKSWNKFENFLADMGVKPEGASIDRIDNSKGYSKENCRWSTQKEQQNNRTNNKRFKGKTLTEWSVLLKIKRSTLAQRIYVYGWSVNKALTTASKIK